MPRTELTRREFLIAGVLVVGGAVGAFGGVEAGVGAARAGDEFVPSERCSVQEARRPNDVTRPHDIWRWMGG